VAGSYLVTVTVTDSNGLTATATQSVTVDPPAPPARAQYVNQIATNYSTNQKTSGYVTVWRPEGVAAGDLIVVTVQLTGTSATGAVTGVDAAGDTMNVAADQADGSGDRLVVLSGVAKTGLQVNDRITISFPTATSYRIDADEVAGASGPDRHASAVGTTGSFSSGGSGVTVQAGELAFGTVATFGGAVNSWGSGWTGLSTYAIGSNTLGRAYQVPAINGTVAASGTCTGTWLAAVVTFG
jgi:hypothetical protein